MNSRGTMLASLRRLLRDRRTNLGPCGHVVEPIPRADREPHGYLGQRRDGFSVTKDLFTASCQSACILMSFRFWPARTGVPLMTVLEGFILLRCILSHAHAAPSLV